MDVEMPRNEEENDLFKQVIGECLSKEQYAEWKRLRKEAGDVVSSDEDEPVSLSLLNLEQDVFEEGEIRRTNLLTRNTQLTAGDVVSSDEDEPVSLASLHLEHGNLEEGEIQRTNLLSTNAQLTDAYNVCPSTSVPEPCQSETVITTSLPVTDNMGESVNLSDLDPDITTKFLNGEIDFSEFSEMMERVSQSKEQGITEGVQTQTDIAIDEAEDSRSNTPNFETEGDVDDDSKAADDDEDDSEEGESQSEENIIDDDDEEWTPNTETGKPKLKKKSPKMPRRKPFIKVKITSPQKKSRLSKSILFSPKQRNKKRKGVADLPKHLQGLMGEAHLKFARGEHDEATKMCMEVIRLAPMAAEPFQTLGLLYEELGDMQKSLQFCLIAAHLRPQDPEEWSRLAEMSVELGEIKQAVTCYTKALKYDPKNVGYVMDRCTLWEQLKETKKVLDGFHYLLKILPKTEGDKYLQIARDMAKIYHENGESDKAIETLKQAFDTHSEKITSEDVNLLLELQMAQKTYKDALKVLVCHCGVVFYTTDGSVCVNSDAAVNEEDVQNITRCTVSEWLPIDLRVKLAVCVIHLEKIDVAKSILVPLCEEPVESSGDLYLDVAEAYMETGRYTDAKLILEKLVKTKNYGLAAVWLRYAECLSVMGELDQSEEAFSKVVELAPNHTEARVALSNLQQKMGRSEDALKTLSNDAMGRTDLSGEEKWLLLHKCMMLYSQKKYEEFASNCKTLICSHMKDVYSPSYLRIVLSYHTIKHRNEALKLLAKIKPQILITSNITGKSSVKDIQKDGLSKDELWDIFVKLFDVLIDLGRLSELEELAVLGLTCPLFINDEEKAKEMEDLSLLAFMLNKNGQYAYRFVKEICMKEIDNVNVWNLFCQVMIYAADMRHHRFCMRCSLKNPNHLQLSILNGHNSMTAGSYKHSLGEYINALRKMPNDPMLNLCVGVTFVHLATQKFSDKRHALLAQGCCFLQKYLDLRGECQETFYNIGRAMHQLDLKYAAVHYYKKALSFGAAIEGDEDEFNLQKEIVHNLALIYSASKSDDYARYLLQTYCVI